MKASSESDLEWAGLNASLCTLIVRKLQFHKSHPQYEGSLTLTSLLIAQPNISLIPDIINKSIVQELIDNLKSIQLLSGMVFSNFDEIKRNILNPISRECAATFALLTFCLVKLCARNSTFLFFNCLFLNWKKKKKDNNPISEFTSKYESAYSQSDAFLKKVEQAAGFNYSFFPKVTTILFKKMKAFLN